MRVVNSAPTKARAENVLSEMEGCRFASFSSMEEWIRYHMENDLPDLNIQECPLNEEIADGKVYVKIKGEYAVTPESEMEREIKEAQEAMQEKEKEDKE